MMRSQGIPKSTLVFQNAEVNGVRLAYERAGQGFPMLLIHGFPRDRRLWRKLVPLLAHRFDAVALDRRGYGESDPPTDPATYDNRTMTKDALELARHLGLERCVVVGRGQNQQRESVASGYAGRR